MAGRSGRLTLHRDYGNSGSIYAYIDWSTTLVSGSTYELYMALYASVSLTGVSSRTCWYHLYINGQYVDDGNKKITEDDYVRVASYTTTITANKNGTWSGTLGGLVGFSTNSVSEGKAECSGNTSSGMVVGDPNYVVTYYKNDGSGGVLSSNNSSGSVTITSSTLTHPSNSTTTNNFTITAYSNGGDTNNQTLNATETVKVQYDFLGWSTSSSASSASYVAGNTFAISNDLNLYAVWKNNSATTYSNNSIAGFNKPTWATESTYYTVTLNANANTASVTPSTLDASIITTHTYKGWGTSANSTSALSNSTTYTSTAYVYAIWDTKTEDKSTVTLPTPTRDNDVVGYTVTLNNNDGTNSTSTVKAGMTTTYSFNGWSTSSGASSGNIPAGSYKVTSTTTLYATWKANDPTYQNATLPTPTRANKVTNHTITLNGNGGTTTTKSVQTSTVVTYTFNKWATTSNASVGTIPAGSYTPTQDITLYAIWITNSPTYPKVDLPTTGLSKTTTSNLHTTTLNLNGGTCSTKSVQTGTRTTYSFRGWSTTTSASNIVNNSFSSSADDTLYAIWNSSTSDVTVSLPTSASISKSNKVDYYKVTFDPGNGSVSPTYKNAYTTTVYTFLGWYTANSSSSTYKISNTTSYKATSDGTIYARWSESSTQTGISIPTPTRNDVNGTFKVTLSAGSGGTIASTITNPITVESNTSFTFGGWATTAGDASTVISNTSNYKTTSAHTLYAIWNPDVDTAGISLPTSGITKTSTSAGSYKVTLNPVDGTVNPTSRTAARTTSYTFKGWATTSGATSVNVSSTNYVPVADVTLYAVYTNRTTTAAVKLPNATKTDHTFLGWTEVEGNTNYKPTTYTPTKAITLYANYLANYRASLWIWYNGKWNKCTVNLFTGDRFNTAI